ncbi:MAG: S8 family peptidase [Bacteroidia bacterium]|nr:S8 family peptidase [Bacteroidia bacterium]
MVKDTAYFKKMYGTKIRIDQVHRSTKCIQLTVQDVDVLLDLKSDPNVLFVDKKRKPHIEGNFDLVNPAINRINQVHNTYPGLHGAGINVSVKEENFNETDIDLKGRTFKTSSTPSIVSQHATAMAILIGGAGNSSPQAEGVVKQVSLTASDFNNLMPDDNALFINNKILVQNHSYGVNIENYYGNEAVAYDQQVSDNTSLVHVFSSGNLGVAKPINGTYKDLVFANLTGTFKQSKNVLVISAIDTTLQVNAFNSRGPTYDGRLKPELTAYGPGGTSEAAAITTGMVTLLQEKYQLTNGHAPDASLVKAILIASADDIRSTGIDFVTGYGNINAYKALSIVDHNNVFETSLVEHDQVSFPIAINQGVSELKVAISWTDPPATVNSNAALVNDIDGWIDTGSNIFLPWVLSTFPHIDSLNAPAKRKQDHLNNVEFITISKPPPGTYQLVLKSGTLTGASQKVSIAYYLNKATDFSWTFPVASDIVPGGVKNLLVWDAQINQVGDLYMQLNSGDWQLIRDKLNLQTTFKWKPPDTLAKAKLKMLINDIEFLSDEFYLSPQLELKTAFNCKDSLGLYWNKISNATSYDVFALGTQYLEPILSTSDTLIVLNKPAPTYFAVVPKLNQTSGIKSGTIDYSKQDTYCYFNFFSANRIGNSEIEIKLSLSSFYHVDHITILKIVNGREVILSTILTDELDYTFVDFIQESGVYTYQAKISFKNNATLLSDPAELIIESLGKAILWPNPVTSDDYLNIISEGNVTFQIINQVGQIVYDKELTVLKNELDIDLLPAGFYIYQLLIGKTIKDTGRIIKL